MGFFDRKLSRRAFVVGGAATAALAPTLAKDALAEIQVDQEEVKRFWSLDPKGRTIITSKSDWIMHNHSMKMPNYRNYPQRFHAESVKADASFAHAIWNSGQQFVLENPVGFGVGDIIQITSGGPWDGERYLVTKLQDYDKFWVEAVPVIETRGEIKADVWSDWVYQYDRAKGVF